MQLLFMTIISETSSVNVFTTEFFTVDITKPDENDTIDLAG